MKTIPRQDVLVEGGTYTVGMGDKEFTKVIYVGEGVAFNKPMFKFKTQDGLDLNINPSFHGWTKEEISE